MGRPLDADELEDLEALARQFCECRAEYRRRKHDGTLGRVLEARMLQNLNALDVMLERLKRGDEVTIERVRRLELCEASGPALRLAR